MGFSCTRALPEAYGRARHSCTQSQSHPRAMHAPTEAAQGARWTEKVRMHRAGWSRQPWAKELVKDQWKLSPSPASRPQALPSPLPPLRSPPQLCLFRTWALSPATRMMMWSNFFMHEEDRRRRAHGARKAKMTPEHEGKIKLALLLTSVGATLAVLAVGTEFWVELNTYRDNGSAVCDAAHLGLWKMCTKRLWQADVPAGRDTCGPAELPGEANCTYFKFFTTGEDAHIFQRTTKKEVNMAAAVIAVLGMAVMALGCLCVIMVLSKGAEFLLRVAAICFGLSDLDLESARTVAFLELGVQKNSASCEM
ncbi:voltage-dependent calcium channel gamma-6 subunit isoform X3 [Lagenorhynchus albirostris]|uniref:voltage-dependent calcium channel gamma-6 subunit isoform X3 n=1 Tax=Lagenorhynchus albirostris TaxID=27610 RepID=UPI0028E3CD26|nr:voltage-dependent calcium channel gamma-6 subunit isoform X3 [Lagenorhynchus albirostris]